METPVRFRGHADGAVPEIDIAPRDESSLGVAESAHEVKLETHFFGRRAVGEQLFEFRVLLNRANRLNKSRPVGSVKKLRAAVLFQYLAQHDQLVVNALALLRLLQAVRGEVEKIRALDLVDVGLGAESFEAGENRAVGAEGAQAAVIANVLAVFIESVGDGGAFQRCLFLFRRRDDTAADG